MDDAKAPSDETAYQRLRAEIAEGRLATAEARNAFLRKTLKWALSVLSQSSVASVTSKNKTSDSQGARHASLPVVVPPSFREELAANIGMPQRATVQDRRPGRSIVLFRISLLFFGLSFLMGGIAFGMVVDSDVGVAIARSLFWGFLVLSLLALVGSVFFEENG